MIKEKPPIFEVPREDNTPSLPLLQRQNRFFRLIYNVDIPSRENSRLSKSLEIKLEIFSRIQALALIFSSYVRFISLITNDNMFITIVYLNKFVLLPSSRCRPTA